MKELGFVLIGAAKCATSSIGGLIRSHPQIFFIHEREDQAFFARDAVFARGREWYESRFEDAPEDALLGASNNLYSEKERYPDVPERIAGFWSDTKLIYVVRDPLKRLPSMWMQQLGGEKVHHDFNESLLRDGDWLIGSSNYWRQLEAYRKLFDDSQIHIVFYEDFKVDAEETIVECLDFLGVDIGASLDWSKQWLNPTRGKKMPPGWLRRLRSESGWYRPAVKILPTQMKQWMKDKFLFKPVTGNAVLRGEARGLVLEHLREDSLRLLEYCGKPADFWDLA